MRLGNKHLVLVPALMLISQAHAAELANKTGPAVQKLGSVKVQCSDQQAYSPQGGKSMGECRKCADSVKQWLDRLQKDNATAVGNDNAIVAKTKSSIAAKNAAMLQQQKSNQNTASGGYGDGNQGQAQRSSNASDLGQKFSQCSQEVEQSCQGNIADQDKQAGQDATKACDEGAQGAQAVAAEKAGSGMDMGQLGQMASQLAQGLGSMMQKKQGESSAPTPTDTSSSSLSEATPASTLADSKGGGALQQAQTAAFDGLGAAKVADIGANGTKFNNGANGTNVLPAASQSYDSGGTGTGSESSTFGSDPRGGSGGMMGGLGTSGGGAGSGGNSSGASTFDPDAAAAKAAAGGQDASGAYEITGGGSGSRFLGLKSKSGELSDLDGALGTEAGGAGIDLASLGGDEAGRDPASEGEAQAADIHADGSSLFNVVRSKLVEIKKRGNI